jgi:hypothetical protein
MDEADIYYVDTRNAVPVMINPRPGTLPAGFGPPGVVRTVAPVSAAGRAIYPQAMSGARIYPSTYPSPYMVGSSAGALGGLFGGMTGGQLVDLVAQIFAAVMPLPASPTATSDAATDVGNLVLYQTSLAQYAKRDEQIRTLGNLVTKLLG